MQNRAPTPREDRPPLPDFTPVPRKYRHDGWTPERQKAFIEALADTGSVSRAARMVNMAQANCYTLRRAAGAEAFRKAWDAALDFGVARLKDIAFERAIHGYQVPVFVGGRLAGYRRKTNDALLMFCLRHYGSDAQGRRTTINYFSTRAEAGAGAAEGTGAVAQASTTTVRTVISGGEGGQPRGSERDTETAQALEDFAGVALDAEAEAAISAALAACAARRRETDAAIAQGGVNGAAAQLEDEDTDFAYFDADDEPTWLTLDPVAPLEPLAAFGGDEAMWEMVGEVMPHWVEQEAKGDHPYPTAKLVRSLQETAMLTEVMDRIAGGPPDHDAPAPAPAAPKRRKRATRAA